MNIPNTLISAATIAATATPICSARTLPATATRKPTIATRPTAPITIEESTTRVEELMPSIETMASPGSPRPISTQAMTPRAMARVLPSSCTMTRTAAAIAHSSPRVRPMPLRI